jgi:hypothetical protein
MSSIKNKCKIITPYNKQYDVDKVTHTTTQDQYAMLLSYFHNLLEEVDKLYSMIPITSTPSCDTPLELISL